MDKIFSRPLSREGRDNWERIFGDTEAKPNIFSKWIDLDEIARIEAEIMANCHFTPLDKETL